jgi:hypothetical protein
MGLVASDDKVTASRLGLKERRICLPLQPTRLHRHPTAGQPTLLRPFIAPTYRYGNINPFPINYAFRPRLRDRLTLGRLTLPRKPWAYGEQVFHLFYRYSCQHNHFPAVQLAFRLTFVPQGTLPYRPRTRRGPVASVPCLAPLHFRRRVIRPVSYYAFFKGWLLLSQPPGCLNDSTSFPTEHGFRDLSRRFGLFPFRPWTFAPTV